MAKPASTPLKLFGFGAALLAAIGVTNCGGTSGTRTGTGGNGGSSSTGTGGTTGTGGSGGGTGTGGAGGGVAGLSCIPGFDPTRALITDFSDWDAATGKWGMAGGLKGSRFGYPGNTGSAVTAAIDTTAQKLVLSGTVVPATTGGGFAGGGMSFDSCVNTATYSGIQFTLGGSTAGCDVVFNIQTFSQQAASNGGGCDSSIPGNCYRFPKVNVPFGTAPITVMFTQFAGTGMPATAEGIKAAMVGLQWQFQSPPGGDGGAQASCTGIAMTIDDVAFVP